jgi:hypothetical protein
MISVAVRNPRNECATSAHRPTRGCLLSQCRHISQSLCAGSVTACAGERERRVLHCCTASAIFSDSHRALVVCGGGRAHLCESKFE